MILDIISIGIIYISMNACSIDNVMPKYEKTIETKLIKMLTTKGDITIELFHDKAPKTVDNFLRYIKERKFNGTIFHRVINGLKEKK